MRTYLPTCFRTVFGVVAVFALLTSVGCGGGGGTTITTQTPSLPPAGTITVTISPSGSVGVAPGGSITFHASITGSTNTAVNWSVQEANGGTITTAGVYTAPVKLFSNPSTFHVIAASQADPAKSSAAAVIVGVSGQSVSGSISPGSASLLVNGTTGFQAVGFDIGVVGWAWHWSVKEGAAGGSIVANENDFSRAVYTAPATPGTFHIVLIGETLEVDAYGNPYLEVDTTATVTVLPAATPGTFISTGSMLNMRGGFTATLLRDGRVLVAGGDNSIVADESKAPPSTAEIYDPAKGTFSATGPLTTSRYNHAVVALPDGRVFLAGGYRCMGTWVSCTPSALSSAELYDPSTGMFTATANMLAAHVCPNALAMPNGKVLILGAASDAVTAEFFDPATGTFTAANTSSSRELFKCPAAVLLANGKVLIAPSGPYYDPGPSTLEIFDPGTGQYTTTASISGPNPTVDISAGTSLTVLKTGLVLVAGSDVTGCTAQDCDVVAFDGTSWLFDPAAAVVQPTGSMHVGRLGFAHTLLQDGTVLVTGGYNDASAEIYDPKSATFSSIAPMSVKRYRHTSTLLNDGRVLIVGGDDPSAELYYPAAAKP